MTLLRVKNLNEYILTAQKIILAFLLILSVYSFSFSPTSQGFVDDWQHSMLGSDWKYFAPIVAQIGVQGAYLALVLFLIYLISGSQRKRTLFSLQLAFTCYAVGYVWIHYGAYGMLHQIHFLQKIPWGQLPTDPHFGQSLTWPSLIDTLLYLFIYWGSGILSLIAATLYTLKRFDRMEFIKISVFYAIQAICYMLTPGFYLWRFQTW